MHETSEKMFSFPPPPPRAATDVPAGPFVADTLFRLLGGPFVLRQIPFQQRLATLPADERAKWLQQLQDAHAEPAAQTIPGPVGSGADTVEVYRPDRDQRIVSHEAGHVMMARGLFPPEVLDSLDAGRERFRPSTPQDTHYARSGDEYYAETFSRALQALRQGKSERDVQKVDRQMPGVLTMWHYLQTRPPFGGTQP
jgi:hypothetical protein